LLQRVNKENEDRFVEEEAMGRKSSGSKVRFAVVGLGHIAQVAVLPAFKMARNSEIVALISGDPRKRKVLGKKYRSVPAFSYEDYDQVLAQVDAVYLALPNHLHKEYAVRAAEAGVHVLCEKPMAVTEEECETMISAAEDNGVKLMVAYRLHFEKGNLEAIRTIKKNRLGKPRIFTSEFAQQVKANNVRVTEPVSRGGGPVYDMGVYCINAARYLFGAEPTKVLALSASNPERRFQKVDEMMSAILRFPDERLASFTCSFGAADISRYTVVGTKGVMTSDPAYEYAMNIEEEIITGGKKSKRKFAKRDQFAAQIDYFSDCILENRTPEPSGLEGLADVRIVRGLYESARSGKAVALPPFPRKKKPSIVQEIHRPAHGKPQTVNAQSPTRESA
jgi:glucose-fructose oxidoreductase